MPSFGGALPKRNAGGFAGVVFLVIALIAVVMAAIAIMSRGSSSGLPDQNGKAYASVLLKQAADLRGGFDRMLIDNKTASLITFDSAANTGLFDPTGDVVYALQQTPPAGLMVSGTPAFNYHKLVKLPGIGITANDDYAFVVGDISSVACQQINKTLYSDATTLAPGTSTGSLSDWTTGAAIDDSGATTRYVDRPEGCVVTSDAKYVYYKAAFEN